LRSISFSLIEEENEYYSALEYRSILKSMMHSSQAIVYQRTFLAVETAGVRDRLLLFPNIVLIRAKHQPKAMRIVETN